MCIISAVQVLLCGRMLDRLSVSMQWEGDILVGIGGDVYTLTDVKDSLFIDVCSDF